jgi:Spy/CpxP family protein refolding chaperone
MRNNSTALMTALLLTLLMSLSPPVRAQDNKPRDLDTLNTDRRLKQMATVLALTDEQKEKTRPIILEEVKAVRLLREDETIPLQERFAKEDVLRQACRAKLKTVLTAEQFQKLEDAHKKAPKKTNPKPQ